MFIFWHYVDTAHKSFKISNMILDPCMEFCNLIVARLRIDDAKTIDELKNAKVKISLNLSFLRNGQVCISESDLADLNLHNERVDFSFGDGEGCHTVTFGFAITWTLWQTGHSCFGRGTGVGSQPSDRKKSLMSRRVFFPTLWYLAAKKLNRLLLLMFKWRARFLTLLKRLSAIFCRSGVIIWIIVLGGGLDVFKPPPCLKDMALWSPSNSFDLCVSGWFPPSLSRSLFLNEVQFL